MQYNTTLQGNAMQHNYNAMQHNYNAMQHNYNAMQHNYNNLFLNSASCENIK